MRNRGRISALLLGLVFLLQGSCFLSRPGINAGEVQWAGLKSWIFALVFVIANPGPRPLRMVTLAAGAGTLFVACRLFRRGAGATPAIVGGMLLATDSGFLLANRLDTGTLAFPLLLSTAGCLFLLRFWQHASRVSLIAGFLCAGLAIWNRPELAWVWVGLAAAALIVFRPEIAAVWGARNLLPAGAAFLAGLSPLIFFPVKAGTSQVPRWSVGGPSWFDSAIRTQPGTWGIGPRGFLETTCMRFSRALGSPRVNALDLMFLGAFAAAALCLPWIRRQREYRVLSFTTLALALGALALVCSGPLSAGRILLLWPFPHFLLAIVLTALARRSAAGIALLVTVASVLVVSGAAVTATYFSDALLFGGASEWTEAIYGLASNLDVHDARSIRILSDGIEAPLRFLRGGNLPVVQTSEGEDTLFISRTGAEARKELAASSHKARRRIHVVSLIQDGQGRAMFTLFHLE